MRKCLALLLLVVLSAVAYAGPMGFDAGMTLEQLKAIDPELENIGGGTYMLSTAPNPSDSFIYYVVKVHPDAGLIMLRLIGKNI